MPTVNLTERLNDLAGQAEDRGFVTHTPFLTPAEKSEAEIWLKKTKVPQCDFGICINAILTPDLKDRTIFFQSLSSCVKKGGRIVLSIPSLESWMLTSVIQQQHKIDNNLFPVTKNAKEALRKWNNIRKGNADIDEVPHKHYLKEELQLLLANEGFIAEDIQKIEYNWDTEFIKPPKWLKEPRPWDWMVVARKK